MVQFLSPIFDIIKMCVIVLWIVKRMKKSFRVPIPETVIQGEGQVLNLKYFYKKKYTLFWKISRQVYFKYLWRTHIFGI